MQELKTEIQIDASAEEVWSVLMDFEAYPEWNPFIVSISGKQSISEKLEIVLNTGRKMKITPEIQEIEPKRRFSWLGRILLPRLFDGKHIFEIKENGGGTKFVHREEFRGILVWPLLKIIGKQTKDGFESMNKAIKKRVETPPKQS